MLPADTSAPFTPGQDNGADPEVVYTDLKEKDALLRQQNEQLSTMEHMYTELVTQVGGAMISTRHGTDPWRCCSPYSLQDVAIMALPGPAHLQSRAASETDRVSAVHHFKLLTLPSTLPRPARSLRSRTWARTVPASWPSPRPPTSS
jgi:hypothetical protein